MVKTRQGKISPRHSLARAQTYRKPLNLAEQRGETPSEVQTQPSLKIQGEESDFTAAFTYCNQQKVNTRVDQYSPAPDGKQG